MTKTLGAKEWANITKNCVRGCPDNCRYCWAATLADRRFQKHRSDWHNAELNERAYQEIMKRKSSYKTGQNIARIMFPSTHNITEEFLPQCIEVLKKFLTLGNPVLIVIKPKLKVVKELCKALTPFKELTEFRLTIGSLFTNIIQFYEENSSLPTERIECAMYIKEQGFDLSFSMEPWLDIISAVPYLIKALQKLVSQNKKIWLGPMNKDLIGDKSLWDEEKWGISAIRELYALILEDKEINLEKLAFKDSFRSVIPELNRNKDLRIMSDEINCPKCGIEMNLPSSSAVSCPKCGYYKQYDYEHREKTLKRGKQRLLTEML